MSRVKKWTDQQMIDAVRVNKSIRQVLVDLSLHPTGANYQAVHSAVARLQLDTSHWTGQGWLRGESHNFATRTPLARILVENSTYQNVARLKDRLIREGAMEERCSSCGLTHWLGEKLSLVLDHINGRNRDHRLENLRLLCPNCNSLQPTFAGRNKRRTPPEIKQQQKARWEQNRKQKRTPEMRRAEYERAKERKKQATIVA